MPDKQYSTSWQSAKQKAKDRTRQRNPSQIGYNIVSDLKKLSLKDDQKLFKEINADLDRERDKKVAASQIKGMPMFSPVRGNRFSQAMADAGGDYDKAKAMLDNDVATMKSEYGTGSAMMYKSKSVLVGTLGDDIKKDQESQVQPSGTIQRQRFKSIKDRVKRDQQ
jgi:hypothetical protein